MMSSIRLLVSTFLAGALLIPACIAQTPSPTPTPPYAANSTAITSTTSSSAFDASAPPDVYLNVPQLSVGRIELDVDNLQADINLGATVAKLVTINAGVQVSVTNINLTIADIDAELELVVRLGHLVDIVNRVFSSVDLNPLLVSVANATTSLLGDVVGEVDSLLGTITQGGTTLSFIVDNLGNIVQQVTGTGGNAVGSIVGNYLQNMTYTGQTSSLGSGLTQKVYSYSPLNALVDIVFNAAGQVVQATVQKNKSSSSSTAVGSTTAPTATSSS
ncbi:hypothetical protein H2203_006915 [Taxawa tesnikishii (nom. ined.)]|nr:hypothetical protein H2203_006915 [Dothideales sp. JES 119]